MVYFIPVSPCFMKENEIKDLKTTLKVYKRNTIEQNEKISSQDHLYIDYNSLTYLMEKQQNKEKLIDDLKDVIKNINLKEEKLPSTNQNIISNSQNNQNVGQKKEGNDFYKFLFNSNGNQSGKRSKTPKITSFNKYQTE